MEVIMSLFESMSARVKNLDIIDMKLAQGAAMCVMLIIAKLIPQIMTISIWWFVVLAILLGIKPLITFYSKK